ncbi:heme peroxidase [Suillus fuscotomentosus]|uniref:Heme peroxidase n=1 Tax=Suillus fuscotomentosus TaxID=1912939 RepID=A0AAD4HL04_9AGAM|nr:heme peroxidase [Suillus fuscotomentosus]KAG1901545.1 heme peroxidase [Suillus fuscotomentosus]
MMKRAAASLVTKINIIPCISDQVDIIALLGGTKSVEDFEQMITRGPAFTLADLPAYVDALKNLKSGIDDREFLLEKLLMLMSRLPDDSVFAKELQISVINILYKDLPHPPYSFLKTPVTTPPSSSSDMPYIFRSADGSNYSMSVPNLGQAGQPYARSVPSTHVSSRYPLPDPGEVFDTLLRRGRNDFVPHPGGLSSLFFAFADLIIHSIFDTNSHDWTINNASSYLDLSILYGHNEEQVDSIRKKDGTGHIWEDVFADKRLLFMPPSVGALAVLFSRHHNYIASKILSLNERGTFARPADLREAQRTAQCDEIFHRARLVNTAFFMQIILTDYVGGILGLVRDGLTWRLNPLQGFREQTHDVSQRGAGNAVSLEFNMLYRWHAAMSRQDEAWIERTFKNILPDRDPSTITVEEFKAAVHKDGAQIPNIHSWTFGGLTREKDGRFSDANIARVLQDATADRACAFRARGVPAAMRIVEILGMEQARAWGACSLNEFRRFIGLKPYKSFSEWNPDPEIYIAAERLYGDIENLELHVGLQAEETKPPIPGAGLCPGYTISRAILADAVCLTRGDRFLTVDFTPFNLTTWGYEHCMVNKVDGSYGGMLTKLLFHMLPDHYPVGSVYAHFPFLTPEFLASSMTNVPHGAEIRHLYNWDRPLAVQQTAFAATDTSVVRVYDCRLSKLHTPPRVRNEAIRKPISDKVAEHTVSTSHFAHLTSELILKRREVDKHVDILEILNLLPVYWVGDIMVGLPLMDKSSSQATPEFWYKAFFNIAHYLYFNNDPASDWILREKATRSTQLIMLYLEGHLKRLSDGIISINGICDLLFSNHVSSHKGEAFLSEVLKVTPQASIEEIALCLFEEIIPSAALFSAVIASVVKYYMYAQNEDYSKFSSSCREWSEQSPAVLRYICKALDLDIDMMSSGKSVLRITLDGQVVVIPKQTGLMSWDIFSKIAPGIICNIFHVDSIRRPRIIGKATCVDAAEQTSRFTNIPTLTSMVVGYDV